jgi:hypothetical protein
MLRKHGYIARGSEKRRRKKGKKGRRERGKLLKDGHCSRQIRSIVVLMFLSLLFAMFSLPTCSLPLWTSEWPRKPVK